MPSDLEAPDLEAPDLEAPDLEAVAERVFAALADPSRRAILALLAEAGLVTAEPGERRRVRYRLRSAPMRTGQPRTRRRTALTARDLLRTLPVFDRPLPDFDTETAPDEPVSLFVRWLGQAVAAGVVEPQVMTLCTVDAVGRPDSRVLILRDVSDDGWQFTTSMLSAKGTQLAANPNAGLNFYWREQGRQVRVRGQVWVVDRADSEADFLAQSDGSRIAGLVGGESTVLEDPAALPRAIDTARRRLAEDPLAVAPDHAVCMLDPAEVEFWQGDQQRQHVRLRYRWAGAGAGWVRERLWP